MKPLKDRHSLYEHQVDVRIYGVLKAHEHVCGGGGGDTAVAGGHVGPMVHRGLPGGGGYKKTTEAQRRMIDEHSRVIDLELILTARLA